MKKYFEVIVLEVLSVGKNGKEKTKRTPFLVDALTVTEAEAKVHKDYENTSIDYTVTSVKESKIVQVIN